MVQRIDTSISFLAVTHDAHGPCIYSFGWVTVAERSRRPKRGLVGAVPVLVYGYRTWHFSLASCVDCPAISTQPTVKRARVHCLN